MFYSFSCIFIWSCCMLKIQLIRNYLPLSEGCGSSVAVFWYPSTPIKTSGRDGAFHGASEGAALVPAQTGLGGGTRCLVPSARVTEAAGGFRGGDQWRGRGQSGASAAAIVTAEAGKDAAAASGPVFGPQLELGF